MVEENNKEVEEEEAGDDLGQNMARKRINLGVAETGKVLEEEKIKLKGANSILKTSNQNIQESSPIQLIFKAK